MKVRDLLRRLVEDGWIEVRTRGSHRILKHPIKTGTVVIAGQLNKDIAIGTLKIIAKQAELEDL
ncbi:MAG TPA: type II toxin-antitoxin system HicA family toxin [Thermoguttaceae bacterium]